MSEKDIKQYIDNMIWHISTNTEVLGEKRMLEDICAALKNIQNAMSNKKIINKR